MQACSTPTPTQLGSNAEAVRRISSVPTNSGRDGRLVPRYGAPAKGNTLLNYCDISTDPSCAPGRPLTAQSLPGSRLPIASPDQLLQDRPDYVLILPWNLKDEIVEQMRAVRDWGGQFVVPIPEVLAF